MSRRVAVLIASSEFPDEPALERLVAPERDVEGMLEVLLAEKGGVFDEVVTLKNQPSQKVRLAINRALRNAGRDDQLLIYYSGHGKLDPTGKLCLAMSDTVLDVLQASSIRIGEIKDFLDASKCKQVMLFLDCCYSGAVGKDFLARGTVDDQLLVAAETSGICIMSAANAVQIAMESRAEGLGVFTRHVIEGIKTGCADQNGDGLVTFDELYDYVQKKVIADGHQRPQRWSFQAEGNLVIARSGNWDELRGRLRAKVLELANSQELPDDMVSAALSLLGVNKSAHTREQSLQLRLLEEFASGKTKLANFSFAWARSTQTATPLPMVEPEPVEASAPAEPEEIAPPTPSAPAALAVWPGKIDFGRHVLGETASELLKVWNDGPGQLDWSHQAYGDFFELDRNSEGLTVTLVGDSAGKKQGLIKLSSSAGNLEVEVSARIVEKPRSPKTTPTDPPAALPIPQAKFGPGRWFIELNAYGIPGAKYTLDLLPNGALFGGMTIFGVAGQIQGGWSFDPSQDRLLLQLGILTFGMHTNETLDIHITELQGNTLKGRDAIFCTFSFRRVGEAGVGQGT